MKPIRPRWTFGIVILLLLLHGLVTPLRASGARQDEYQVKAGFVLNFALLTEWSQDSQGDKETFSIAVLGKIPSGTFISTLKSLTVHGKRIAVKHIETAEEAKNVRLLFISSSERHRLSEILKELRGQSILTVSDMSGFCEAGGMIGLVPVQNRIGFEVNLGAVRKVRLSVSSQMLKLARVVIGN